MARPRSTSCASTTAMAAMLTMSETSVPRLRTCTGLAMPIRIGPMATAPPRGCRGLSPGLAAPRAGDAGAPGRRSDHLQGGPDDVRVVVREPGDEGVGVTGPQHHRGEIVGLAQQRPRLAQGDPLALPHLLQRAGAGIAGRRGSGGGGV